MNRYISTIARTEFPALLTLTQVQSRTRVSRGPMASCDSQVSVPSDDPHQMELVCNKAFDHEFE